MNLDSAAGRPISSRRDANATRIRLVDGVAAYVSENGEAPRRLADVADSVGISVATAYRYFASVDDVIRAHVLRLPEHAAASFARSARVDDDGIVRFHRWNRAWVGASLEFGPTAVQLRSPEGFLARRAQQEPTVSFVCEHVEPLLRLLTDNPTTDDLVATLLVWNAVSDPREVLDLHTTARWGRERIARFITTTICGTGAR
jgi:AcrR family transcriptional regulator